MVPIAPMLGPGPASESSMSKSFQSGPQEGGTGDMVGKKRRGRPSSRSKVGRPFELVEEEVDIFRSCRRAQVLSQLSVSLLANWQ
jgi:hypothetical protein